MSELTRAEDRPPATPDGAEPLHTLTTKQRAMLILIDQHERGTGEPCSASWLARRLLVDRTTIRQHLEALYRKGWLRTASTPATLKHAID